MGSPFDGGEALEKDETLVIEEVVAQLRKDRAQDWEGEELLEETAKLGSAMFGVNN